MQGAFAPQGGSVAHIWRTSMVNMGTMSARAGNGEEPRAPFLDVSVLFGVFIGVIVVVAVYGFVVFIFFFVLIVFCFVFGLVSVVGFVAMLS